MKKSFMAVPLLCAVLLCFSSCVSTGEKAISVAVVYCVTAVFSVMVFLLYMFGIRKKNLWFVLLFASVFVVNVGYCALAISRTLEEALLANRISYFGSVFLPMTMLMIIFDAIKIQYGKWLTGLLVGAGILVFLIAASPGYLDIYYREVSFVIVDGVGMLQKVYGSAHIIYLLYLMSYFLSMVAFIMVSMVKKKIDSAVHAFILLAAVFINIVVWLLEQVVKIDFEILSVSYVITELFLVSVCFLLQESEKQKQTTQSERVTDEVLSEKTDIQESDISEEQTSFDEKNTVLFFEKTEYKNFMYGLGLLTNAEKRIYDCYIEGKSTKEIIAMLDITENTLKYHNKNIYGKLGVSSRKQLKEIAFKIVNEKNT